MKYSELETPRLVLRGWRESDLEDLFAYCSEPEVGPAAGWQPHADKTVSRGVLRQFMEAGEVWAIVDRCSRRVIGSMGLHEEPGQCQLPNARLCFGQGALGQRLDDRGSPGGAALCV